MTDYSQHLNATDALLQQLRDAAMQGDTAKVAEVVQIVDWDAVASEFETVAGRYRNAVYRHGRKIIRNLRRPYMLYDDCEKLHLQINMLRGAIEDSPSLLANAREELESAYQVVLRNELLRGHRVQHAQTTLHWTTLEALIDAAEAKLQRGLALEAAGHHDYLSCQRVFI